MNRYDLPDILYNSIKDMGGQTNSVNVCKCVWQQHQQELLDSGDLFNTCQYDIRWATTELRKTKRMKAAYQSPRDIWEIV